MKNRISHKAIDARPETAITAFLTYSLIALVGIVDAPAEADEYRYWTTAANHKSNVKLMLVEKSETMVKLKREDSGKVVELRMDQLSQADLQYLRDQRDKGIQTAPGANNSPKEKESLDGNWFQFRGVNSQGISTEAGLPTEWSEAKNVVWKVDLPGKGSSSPVIWGKKLFLTSFSGYGLSKDTPGDMADLVRHLICVDRDTGDILWKKDVPNRGNVQPFEGFIASYHGYASHTPVTDGKAVYCWFANDGVFAFDLNGNQLWQKVPPELGAVSTFGSGASPVLYGELLLVNAGVEGNVFVALDKKTGDEVWRREKIASYTTPVIANTNDGPEMFLIASKRIVAVDPRSGSDLWYQTHENSGYVIPTPSLHEGIVHWVDGTGKLVAVRAGGRGDVSSTHQLWSYKGTTDIPSTVYANGHIYMFFGSILHCVRVRDGESSFKERIRGLRHVFASLLAADGKIYIIGRYGKSVVVKAEPEFELVAENTIADDDSHFNASPAVSDGKLFIRSQERLYCIGRGDSE